MRDVRSFAVIGFFFLRYFLYRLRIVKRPSIVGCYEEVWGVLYRILKWGRRLRVRIVEPPPQDSPVIYCGNHVRVDDPLFMFGAIAKAMGRAQHLRAMMRDDFFVFPPLIREFVAIGEFFEALGVYGIRRRNVTLAQLKPFLTTLAEGISFMMFPGGTRTRSGLFMEYYGAQEEPGRVSFFLHHTQRRNPTIRVAAVPVVRTFNPATKHSTIVIGPPQYLKEEASRGEQRNFDRHLVVVMAELVTLNVPHVLSGLMYLRCLHGMTGAVPKEALARAVEGVMANSGHAQVDERVDGDFDGALAYLEAQQMLRIEGENVLPDTAAILSVPEVDGEYGKKNPVKYLTNQILHLSAVTNLIESAASEL